MDEMSRIRIEGYCEKHKSAKSRLLAKLVEMSYGLAREITDAIFLEKAFSKKRILKCEKLFWIRMNS